jgi:hypothetical protein
MLTSAQIEYKGAIRMPTGVHTGFPNGADTTFSYGGMSGRVVNVGGVDEVHFFVYGRNNIGVIGNVDATDSLNTTTTFQVGFYTGLISQAPDFSGKTISVQRNAGHATGEERTVTSVTNRTTTIASAASASVMTVASGFGSHFSNGMTIYVGPSFESGIISGIVGDVITLTAPLAGGTPANGVSFQAHDSITVSVALGGAPQQGDIVVVEAWDAVYELVDPEAPSCNTGSYNTTYTSAPQACTYANWGNVYHGHRVSWLDDGTMQNPQGVIPWGLHWNPSTSLLYWTYAQQYVSGSIYQLGWSSLDSISSGVGTSTGYGPVKMTTTDGDGHALEGEAAALMLQEHSSGAMLAQGGWYQLQDYPQGPNIQSGTSCATCTNGWPTAATPSGFGSATIDKSNRLLHYYAMMTGNASGNYWNADGSLHGSNIRDFYTTNNSADFITEPLYEGYAGSARVDGDPDQNGGKNSYTEVDTHNGFFFFSGTNRQAAIGLVSRLGITGGDSTNCSTGTHHWYANGGNGIMSLSSTSGYVSGEFVQGLTSGATAQVHHAGGVVDGTHMLVENAAITEFIPGETIHGLTSLTDRTLVTWTRGYYCTHGCLETGQVTGPQSNHFHSAMLLYDQDTLNTNASNCTGGSACSGADWQTQPTEYINLQDAYGIHTAGEDGQTSGGNANLRMGYFDSARDYLFVVANLADGPQGNTTLIHVFALHDSPIPAPLSWAWFMSLAPNWMHHGHFAPFSLFDSLGYTTGHDTRSNPVARPGSASGRDPLDLSPATRAAIGRVVAASGGPTDGDREPQGVRRPEASRNQGSDRAPLGGADRTPKPAVAGNDAASRTRPRGL